MLESPVSGERGYPLVRVNGVLARRSINELAAWDTIALLAATLRHGPRPLANLGTRLSRVSIKSPSVEETTFDKIIPSNTIRRIIRMVSIENVVGLFNSQTQGFWDNSMPAAKAKLDEDELVQQTPSPSA